MRGLSITSKTCQSRQFVVRKRAVDEKLQIVGTDTFTEVWKNLVLVQAKDANEAFEKASKIGKSESGDCRGTLRLNKKPAVTQFLGVSDMGLVYDDLGDGAEILWQLRKCSQRTVRSLATSKKHLLSRLKKDLRTV
jgi:hypothetical protein